MLNNREWAILIWGVGIFPILMARREIRSSVGQLLRIVLSPPLLIPLLLMVAYVVGEVWLGNKARLWRSDLIKDTVVWFAISALALFLGYDQASKQPHFFRRRLLAAISISVFLEFFVHLFVLGLIAELALQPFLLLLGLLIALGPAPVGTAAAARRRVDGERSDRSAAAAPPRRGWRTCSQQPSSGVVRSGSSPARG
jgi:hypothetical protein